MHSHIKHLKELQEKLQYFFTDENLLIMACSHPSYVNENKRRVHAHNERLEFLGDAILGMLVCDFLYNFCSDSHEGTLSSLKAKIVDSAACYHYVQVLEIENYILLGKGEENNFGRGRQKLLANFFEAIIGAIFLDGHLQAAQNFFFTHFGEEIKQKISEPIINYKAQLQEYTQQLCHKQPEYILENSEGPDHDKSFTISVHLDGEKLAEGTGASKKLAQEQAAKLALERYKLQDENG